jgi:NADH-quinone oxidoreductase subunit M
MEIELAEHLVVLVVALPALVGLGLVATSVVLGLFDLPDLPEAVWLAVGLAAGFVTFALMLFGIVIGFDPEQLGLQFAASFVWSDTFGAKLLLGIDGIGLCFMLSTAGLVPLAMLSSRGEERESNRAWVLVCLALETTLLGALASANLISFIFFWSASLLPTMLWVGRWGGPGRARAASRIWTMESLGLAGLLFVAFVLHRTTLEQFGVSNLDLTLLGGEVGRTLLDVRIEESDQWVLFVVMTTGLSVLLATGFVQTAAIGLLRFALPLFPDAAMAAGPTLSVLGIVAFVYASLIALAQRELKRLVAYASVGYAGFAVFGISTFNVQGLTGAVLQLLTHGLATAALFMLIGFLAIRRGTTEVKAFGGLAKPMPVCAFFFGLMVLSLMGLPLLGGFVGDLFVLLGSLETRRELSVIALISIVVAASYLLWVQRRLFLGPVVEPSNRGLIDLDRVERGILLAMAIPIVAIGVYPNPVLRRVEPAVLEILYQMERRSVSVEVEEVDSELVQGGAAETGKSSDR